jgi:hypothetical protein
MTSELQDHVNKLIDDLDRLATPLRDPEPLRQIMSQLLKALESEPVDEP